jgi:histidinol-phosphate aminotransferase
LSNPNNPTGTIYRRREWEAFLKKLGAQTLVVADEAYGEYVEDPNYPPSLSYQADGTAILTLRTFSKLYGLAGLRIGYGVAPVELISLMQRVRQPFNVNAAAQWAAVAALEDADHVTKTIETNRQGKNFLTRELERLRVDYVPSQANFILMRVGQGRKVFEQLLKQGVIVRPMEEYSFPEFIRVTVGRSEENMKFVHELERVLKANG